MKFSPYILVKETGIVRKGSRYVEYDPMASISSLVLKGGQCLGVTERMCLLALLAQLRNLQDKYENRSYYKGERRR